MPALDQERDNGVVMRTGSISLLVLAAGLGLVLLAGCGDAVEKEVVQPVENMLEGRDRATLEAASANVRTIRMALMRYPTTSPDDLFPSNGDIFDYESLREVLAGTNLPEDMADLKWDESYGIEYDSDGYQFRFSVKAGTRDRETITATPAGVTVR
jgi:hypothetical protein